MYNLRAYNAYRGNGHNTLFWLPSEGKALGRVRVYPNPEALLRAPKVHLAAIVVVSTAF